MSGRLRRPRRKSAIARASLSMLPPAGRSRVALGLTAAAALGYFELQVCADCGAVQYPPREACHRCLAVNLKWRPQSGAGELIAATVLHHSHEAYFRDRLPWRIGLIRLDCGPTVLAHVPAGVAPAPCRVQIVARLDRAGQATLVAIPTGHDIGRGVADVLSDTQLRDMTCDPRQRTVLVTDGGTAVGQALARAFVSAGAATVWVGLAAHANRSPTLEDLARTESVSVVPLDVRSSDSVASLCGELGARVDILVNNAEVQGARSDAVRRGVDAARSEMDVNYFGLLRLAQEFGPAMRARSADGKSGAIAWVNLLSIYALANLPAHGTFCASKAAAYSLAQCVRAEMQPGGVRVMNVFPGPIDDGSSLSLPAQKLSPQALAAAIVQGLREGTEDLFPGDVAQDWLVRWRENPMVLERELAMNR
jgi:NAD(P)-dependent dehydrogenase (short-subunit alcohol dehydrogenase family)